MYKVETINYGNDNRVSVYYDESDYTADEILGDSFGMFSLRQHRDYGKIDLGELTDDLNLLCNRIDYSQYESAIGKYLTVANKHHTIIELQGNSQSEWATVMVYSDELFVTTPEFRDALRQYWRGEVYYLVHEQRETFANADGSKTIDQWDAVDSIGGIMTESHDELLSIIKDHFALSESDN